MSPWWSRPSAETEDQADEEQSARKERQAPEVVEPVEGKGLEERDEDERGAVDRRSASRPSRRDEGDDGDDARRRSRRSSRGRSSRGGSRDDRARDDEPRDDSSRDGGDDSSSSRGGRSRRSRSRSDDERSGDRDRQRRGRDRDDERRSRDRDQDDDRRPDRRPRGRRDRDDGGPSRDAKTDGDPASHDITEEDIQSVIRDLQEDVYFPERTPTVSEERKIAVFCDLENVALGVRDSDVQKFDINLVLERLLEKGKVIVKRAYCDWERYSEYKRAFHEAAIEMLDIPQKYYSGKNSADIKMVVDAVDQCYSKEHLDTFVIVSGDSDFSPLVSKLRENDKYVIGVGVKNSSSNLLIDNCDEFIYYEDIWRDRKSAPQLSGMSKKKTEAFGLMVDAIQALIRENKDVLWGSMIKQTMQRKRPSFNEGYYGYGSFSELLEDAEKSGVLKLKKDQRSGSYIITGFKD